LGIPADPLRLRLDFHHQSAVMTYFQGDIITTTVVNQRNGTLFKPHILP